MKFKFDVQMKRKYMFDFLIRDLYKKWKGKLSIVLGIGAILMGVFSWSRTGFQSGLLNLVFGVIFLVIFPIIEWGKAGRLVSGNQVYQLPFTYKVEETGITTIQKSQSSHAYWKQIMTVERSRKCIYVYMDPVTAFIWPREILGEKEKELLTFIREHVEKEKFKIRLSK